MKVFQNKVTGKIVNPRSSDFVLSPWEIVEDAENWDDVFLVDTEIDLIDGYAVVEATDFDESNQK